MHDVNALLKPPHVESVTVVLAPVLSVLVGPLETPPRPLAGEPHLASSSNPLLTTRSIETHSAALR